MNRQIIWLEKKTRLATYLLLALLHARILPPLGCGRHRLRSNNT